VHPYVAVLYLYTVMCKALLLRCLSVLCLFQGTLTRLPRVNAPSPVRAIYSGLFVA